LGPFRAISSKSSKLNTKGPNDTKAPRSAQSEENSSIARKVKATGSRIQPERKSKMTERDEIVKMLRANAGTITENIGEFLIRNAEDLIAAGVWERVHAAEMFGVALCLMVKLDDVCGAVAEMRRRADALEKISARLPKLTVRH
jgi:hypothetical protein